MLFVLPFLVMAIAFLSGYFSLIGAGEGSHQYGLYQSAG